MAQKEWKPGIEKVIETEVGQVEEREFTEKETRNQMLLKEEDLIQGLIEAADYSVEEQQTIEIIREGRLFFRFRIRPLCEDEYNRCKRKHTKYVRNKQLGMKVPEDTDNTKYRSSLIYQATVKEDREKLWDNKKVWEALRNKEFQIMNGLDVIEYSLKAGEKDRILEAIDQLSGYGDTLEEIHQEEAIKN